MIIEKNLNDQKSKSLLKTPAQTLYYNKFCMLNYKIQISAKGFKQKSSTNLPVQYFHFKNF